MIQRCAWVPTNDTLYLDYHDREWGVPVHDDLSLVRVPDPGGLSSRIELAYDSK